MIIFYAVVAYYLIIIHSNYRKSITIELIVNYVTINSCNIYVASASLD